MTDNNSHTAISSSFPPSDWVETTLGEVCEVQNGYAFKADEFSNQGIYVIKIKNIASGEFLLNDIGLYNGDTSKLENYFVKKGDILVSMTGSHISQISSAVGKVCVYNLDKKALLNQRIGNIKPKNNIDKTYLRYLLIQPEVQLFWGTKAGGSANQANISPSIIKSYNFLLPPLPEQQAIASVLSAFDDKIQLLREQNKTLEEMGQVIFQEWFGKYGVDDELPREWRVGKLGEEFDITIGRTPPRAESQWFSGIPTGKKWISIRDIGNSGTYIFDTSEFLTDEAIEKFNIPVIPENTTILSFKMTVGKLTITTEEMLSNEAIAHLKLKNDSVLSSEFIYLYLQNLDFNALGSTSSIVTAINSTMIKNLEVIIPDQETLKQFDEVIQPVFEKIRDNSEQIQSLIRSRDELLPKLMRGEVRVKL